MNQRSRESFSDHRTQALAGRPNEGVAPDPPSPSWSGEPKGGCLGWEGSGTLETIGNAEMLSWYSLDWSYDLADFFRMPCWKCLISTSRFVRSLYTATNVVWQAAMSHSPGVVRTIGLWTEGNDHNQNKFHCSHLYYILYIYVILVVLQFRSMWFACDDIWSHQGMSVAALSSTPSRTSSMTLPRFMALRCRFR